MARFIVETDARSADDLYSFDYGGYQFAPAFQGQKRRALSEIRRRVENDLP